MTKENDKQKNSKGLIIAGIAAVLIVGGIVISKWCCSENKNTPSLLSNITSKKQEDSPIIVAMIGSKKVTLRELEDFKNSIPQLQNMKMDAALYNKLLDAYVTDRVVISAARNANLQNDPLVRNALEKSENQILTQAYLAQKLREQTTNEKLVAVYNKMMASYVPEEEIHARHILVDSEKQAKDLIVKLKAGANFEELANKYTKDTNPAGNNGGDLGYFKKRMMIPEFGEAAFAIKVGQISEKPVKTPFGWHVIKVEDKRQAQKPAIGEILEEVQAKFNEETIPVIVANEMQKANVVKLDPLELNKAAQQAAAAQQATTQNQQPQAAQAK